MARPKIVLSASAIQSLKKCPTLYRNRYVHGVRVIEEPESRRIGSAWHSGLDVISKKPGQVCGLCAKMPKMPDPECVVCGGTGFIDDPLDATIRTLNYRYSHMPAAMDRQKLEIERATVITALFAYKYNYEDSDSHEVLAREIPFSIPLVDPRTRHAVSGVVIEGIIDKLIRLSNGRIAVMEHKSTSESVDPSSDYWSHLRLDTQTLIYMYAAQRLQADGLLEPWKIKSEDPAIDEILYDVWRKPQIKPKKLSKADTGAFVESGEYFGREFEIEHADSEMASMLQIDGEPAEVEVLKNGYAIRETPDMFGARLFCEIEDKPHYYFGRRVINHDHDELSRFEWELFSVYRAIENFKEHDCWYKHEHQCMQYGKCDYVPFCFTGKEIDPNNPPAGFKSIFRKDK